MPLYFAKRTVRALGLLLCLGLSLVVCERHARAADDSEYRRVVEEAVREYKTGNWHEALALFRKAHELNPSARTRRGIGLASFESRRYVDAIRWLSEALNHPIQPLTEEMRGEVRSVLERAREFAGSFELQLTPEDAEIRLDGHPVYIEDGRLIADPGDRMLVVKRQGYEPIKRTLSVRGGDNGELRIELEPTEAAGVAGGPPPEPEPDTSAYEDAQGEKDSVVPWVVLGSGAAVAAAGGVMIGLAMRDISRVENAEGTGKEIQAAQDRVPVMSSLGFGLAAVGLAGAGVGIYLLTADGGSPGDTGDTAHLRLQVGVSSVSVNGRF